jgi:hypothetical protein
VKAAPLRGIFLAPAGTNRNFTEQSSGSFTTNKGQAALFLETIITQCFDAKKLSNCEHRPAQHLKARALGAPPSERRPVF